MTKYLDEIVEVLSMCTNFEDCRKKCKSLNLIAQYEEYQDPYKGHYFIVKIPFQDEILEYHFFQ